MSTFFKWQIERKKKHKKINSNEMGKLIYFCKVSGFDSVIYFRGCHSLTLVPTVVRNWFDYYPHKC
jgi:hypothetical protein